MFNIRKFFLLKNLNLSDFVQYTKIFLSFKELEPLWFLALIYFTLCIRFSALKSEFYSPKNNSSSYIR